MTGMPNACNNLVLRKAGRNLAILFDEVIAHSGLRGGQFSMLAHVNGLDRPTMKKLASELVMDLSALGHTLKPLVRDGYVALVPNEDDGRSKRVVLTEAGCAKLQEAAALWREAQDRFERAFGVVEAKRMREMLALMASERFSVAFRGSTSAQSPGYAIADTVGGPDRPEAEDVLSAGSRRQPSRGRGA